MNKILALTHTRNLEFIRDKEGLTWNLLVPIFLLFALQMIFTGNNRSLFTIGIMGTQANVLTTKDSLSTLPNVSYHYFQDVTKAQKQLEQHQIDLILDFNATPKTYWMNQNSDKSRFLSHLIEKHSPDFKSQALVGPQIRYVDWVMPGVLAINMMYSCLYGIGYGIIRYRRSGYLKRLQSTPLTAFEFLLSQVFSRLVITQVVTILIFISCLLLFSSRMVGNVGLLLLLTILGSLSLISVGLLISARGQSDELSRGLLEVAAWPMLMLSGAFFTLEEAHPLLQQFAQCLPLTHIIVAAREIMLYNASWHVVWPHYLALIMITLIILGVASKMFRWQGS